MTKKLYKVILFLMIIAAVISAVGLLYLPERVPVHYNFSGEVDRYGSKYEFLIFPVLTVITGVFLILVGRRQGQKGKRANEKAIAITNISLLSLYNASTVLFIIATYQAVQNDLVRLEDGLIALMAIMFGLFLIIMGMVMQKVTMNSVIGLRTKWSMYNENTWNKSQRFGGFIFIIQGFVIIILSVALKAFWPLVVMFILLIIDLIIAFVGSYYFYKQEKQKEPGN